MVLELESNRNQVKIEDRRHCTVSQQKQKNEEHEVNETFSPTMQNNKLLRTAVRRCVTTTIRQIQDCLHDDEEQSDNDETESKIKGLSNY